MLHNVFLRLLSYDVLLPSAYQRAHCNTRVPGSSVSRFTGVEVPDSQEGTVWTF